MLQTSLQLSLRLITSFFFLSTCYERLCNCLDHSDVFSPHWHLHPSAVHLAVHAPKPLLVCKCQTLPVRVSDVACASARRCLCECQTLPVRVSDVACASARRCLCECRTLPVRMPDVACASFRRCLCECQTLPVRMPDVACAVASFSVARSVEVKVAG